MLLPADYYLNLASAKTFPGRYEVKNLAWHRKCDVWPICNNSLPKHFKGTDCCTAAIGARYIRVFNSVLVSKQHQSVNDKVLLYPIVNFCSSVCHYPVGYSSHHH